MKNRCRRTQIIIGLAILGIAASRPVALRVDVQTLPVVGDETTLVVATEIAPEDRGRIGTQARMRVKLLRADTAVLHLLLDVDVATDGTARAEIAAPPGTFELEVELTAVRGDAAGFWRGTIAVPVVGNGDTPTLVASAESAPVSAAPATGAAATRVSGEPQAEGTRAPTATAIEAGPVKAATVAMTPQSEAVTRTGPDEPPVIAAPAPVSATVDAELGVAEAAAPPVVAAKPQAPPRGVHSEITSAESTIASPTTLPVSGGTPPGPSMVVIQGTPPTPTEPVPEAPPPRATPTAAPSPQLGDKAVAYLIALDVAEDNLGRASAIYEQFLRVAERDGLTAVEIVPRTSTTTTALIRLAGAVDTIAQPPEGATLVLVTDGLRPRARAEWKDADTAILQAGARLLAIGLWSDAFSAGTRKYLGRTAAYSGGRFYLLQPGESTASVVNFFGLDR